MSAVDELLRANAEYVATFPGPRPKEPRLRLAVVSCMDSRIDMFAALGLGIGDAHILRNGGGLITEDVLRSLAISQRALGTTEVAILHHTDCGMTGFDDTAFRAELAQTGQTPGWDVPGFTDPADQVRRSVQRVRECPWLPARDAVHGFVFDVAAGRLAAVA
ncbi:MAG: carbonic anhydrase [Jatrophihabitans sp.]|nr:MAG: carbonic anhydrase [Jatrophihabitans sp.]